ncbi:hypothetical protein QYM36_007805 [Artemia franciscana]|uniref:TM2 domain-containing protein n=1 Tax=Artemia franciscana TaxID=6661 RepID=A0AA88LKF8_ARTSF|nr:hypothetical protein QYM36_007805 [Artemia franciscana]KAK2727075.1 hypothetical protein QYM36_007805 [Artemia franciscana]KAK2727076.1 hypothetical protein QYM36_007805 [Artemia franciscana]KAK2727077.1 hypothetical protein QYM36_007805 [Artemia franciscana]
MNMFLSLYKLLCPGILVLHLLACMECAESNEATRVPPELTYSTLLEDFSECINNSVKASNETEIHLMKIFHGEQAVSILEKDLPYCMDLPSECITCVHSYQCVYGEMTDATCTVLEGCHCQGHRKFNKTFECRYCYQTLPSEHICSGAAFCKSSSIYKQAYTANCTVFSNVTCLGHRNFSKKLSCNWTSGYRWGTAMLLSIVAGGFGADRFYLGYWQEGIGKLFSFGGLGIWTLIDTALIAAGFLGPADGSLYVD